MNKWMNARTLSSVSISDSDTYYMRKRIHWRELQIIMMSNIYGWTVYKCSNSWASGVVLAIENLPVSTGDGRDAVSIPGLGRFPGDGYGNPFQYSCLSWIEEPSRLWSIGLQRAGHDWSNLAGMGSICAKL